MDRLICIDDEKYRISLDSVNNEDSFFVTVDLAVDNKLVAFKTYEEYTLIEALSVFINVCRQFKLKIFNDDSVQVCLNESMITRDDLIKMIHAIYTVAHDKRHIETEKALEEVSNELAL